MYKDTARIQQVGKCAKINVFKYQIKAKHIDQRKKQKCQIEIKIQLVEPLGVLSSPTFNNWNHPHTGGEHNHHHFSELIQQSYHDIRTIIFYIAVTTKQSADEMI